MSWPVRTRATPGTELAADVSTWPMRAWACGLRRKQACSVPGTQTSSTYRPFPRSSRSSSTRNMLRPVSTSEVDFHGVAQLADEPAAGAQREDEGRLPLDLPIGEFQDGLVRGEYIGVRRHPVEALELHDPSRCRRPPCPAQFPLGPGDGPRPAVAVHVGDPDHAARLVF